jgi:ethanolamine utilization protein EutQ (cupin superfamily)
VIRKVPEAQIVDALMEEVKNLATEKEAEKAWRSTLTSRSLSSVTFLKLMRWSKTFIPTLKEDPADAEVVSHKLLVRAGFIRQLSRGIYDYLPLSLKVIRKIEAIVREEMDRAGAQELLLPIACPAELWQESGRWQVYGKESHPVQRSSRARLCSGPTHEEVITDLVRRVVRSYREMPLTCTRFKRNSAMKSGPDLV